MTFNKSHDHTLEKTWLLEGSVGMAELIMMKSTNLKCVESNNLWIFQTYVGIWPLKAC